jgi:NADPH:quinone reductase-like Zn-dependent oxidoreductase
MKTWELTDAFGLDHLKLVDRSEPTAGIGQVLVKMKAWSLNYRDLMVVRGQYNPKLRFPAVPLSDGVGEIVAVGSGVTRVKPGQRVAGCFMQGWIDGPATEAAGKTALGGAVPGIAAEFVVLSAEGVTPVPAHLSDAEAATLPCAAVTAWHGLVTEGDVRAGETVLVQGTGGVSIFALQFAKMHGAEVIATSGSPDKIARLEKYGLKAIVNYKTTPQWGDVVREKSGGLGVDHVIEVGGAGTLGQSFRAVRTGGKIALIGVLSAGNASEVNPVPVLMKNLRVQGIYVGSRAMFEAMNRAIDAHQMRPVIDRVFGFAELPAAMKHQESGQHFGKVCLSI